MRKLLIMFLTLILLLFFSYAQAQTLPSDRDWYTVGANYQRTSWVAEEVGGDLYVEWYRPIEPYIPYKVQPIATNGKIYISSAKGLYAINAASGNVDFVYPTELPLGHSPTVVNVNNRLTAYVGGYDRKIHAIDANTGEAIPGYTPYEAGAGFETNPLVIPSASSGQATIYAGNRDGKFYALDAITGAKLWEYQTNGPILFSAAYKNGIVYFASNDMYAYALNASDGSLKWKSQKLPGAGFHSFWPVVYTEKITGKDYVIFGAGDNYRAGEMGTEHSEEAKYLFPTCFNDSANNPPTCTYGNLVSATSIAPANDTYWAPGATLLNASKILTYFETYPQRRTTFILDAVSGQEYSFDSDGDGILEYSPFNLTNVTNSGNKYPSIVGIDGILYSGNTYVTAPYIPRGYLVGWKFGSNQISRVEPGDMGEAIDETMSYAGGGKLVYWSQCCDRQAGVFDITIPYGRSGRAWGIWSYYQLMPTKAPDYDPMYNDGNTAHYTDTNGWQVYAGKNQSKNGVYGKHGTAQSPPIPYQGKVYTLKGNTLMVWVPRETSPTKLPLAAIVSANLQSAFISSTLLHQKLEQEVQKIVSIAPLRPGYHSVALYDQYWFGGYNDMHGAGELIDYFQNPADTVYTLLLAYPRLTSTLQQQVKTYLQANYGPGARYDFAKIVHVGWSGQSREAFAIPAENFAVFGTPWHTFLNPSTTPIRTDNPYWRYFPPFSFYAAWKYAQIVGNSNQTTAASIFSSIKAKLEVPPDNYFSPDNNTFAPPGAWPDPGNTTGYFSRFPYILNLYIAGYKGYLELEKLAGLPESATVKATYERMLNLRATSFNKDVPLAWQTGGGNDQAFNYNNALAVARNFMFLTPELGDYLNKNALAKVQEAMNEYTYIAPYWFVPKFEATTGEGTLDHLYNPPALFQAKAYILKEPYEDLVKYLDVPAFERGDLFYIQNLVASLEAAVTLPQPTKGDVNGDTLLNVLDIQACVNHILGIQDQGARADANNDGSVNVLDVQVIVNIILGV